MTWQMTLRKTGAFCDTLLRHLFWFYSPLESDREDIENNRDEELCLQVMFPLFIAPLFPRLEGISFLQEQVRTGTGPRCDFLDSLFDKRPSSDYAKKCREGTAAVSSSSATIGDSTGSWDFPRLYAAATAQPVFDHPSFAFELEPLLTVLFSPFQVCE
jgi:hypothetical protein